MNNCNWEEIHGFETPGEFQRFCAWLQAQIQLGTVEEVELNKVDLSLPFGAEAKYFKCIASGKIWRRVNPDFPFRGLWEAVDGN